MSWENIFIKEIIAKIPIEYQSLKETIYITESIISVKKENKEEIKEKTIKFLEENKLQNLNYIIYIINYASEIRPKERESLFFIISSVFEYFKLDFNNYSFNYLLNDMLIAKNIIEKRDYYNEHIFDFSEEGTIERAIFDENCDKLISILSTKKT